MPRGFRLLRLGKNRGGLRVVHVPVFKQAEFIFRIQNISRRVVEPFHRNQPLADGLFQQINLVKRHRNHAHVHARVERPRNRLLDIRRGAVIRGDFLQVLPIRHDHAAKAEFLAESVGQQPFRGVRRNAVDFAAIDHDCADARVNRRLKWREQDFSECPFRDIRRLAIQPAFRRAIADEMLCAGRDLAAFLIALNHPRAHDGGQIRVFAERFVCAPPFRVAGNIQHRREIPMNAGRMQCLRGQFRAFLGEIGIERGRDIDVIGKNRRAFDVVMPMHGVNAVNQGNPQPRLFRVFLNHVGHFRPFLRRIDGRIAAAAAQNRADRVFHDDLIHQIFAKFAVRHQKMNIDLRHLTDLLFDRHFGEQRLNLFVNALIFFECGALTGKRAERHDQQPSSANACFHDISFV